MNKNILISCIALLALSLTTFGFINKRNSEVSNSTTSESKSINTNNGYLTTFKIPGIVEFVYDINQRYIWHITKEDLDNAKSIVDILPEKATENAALYYNSRISILGEDSETTEVGESEILNEAQLKMLKTTDYKSDFRVTSICSKNAGNTAKMYKDSIVYYFSIIPENQAEYQGGDIALIKYLKENSIEKTRDLIQNKLQPGKIEFTITKDGKAAGANLLSTCGYKNIDSEMVKLIKNVPGKWNPASNAKGEKVDQKLVFFFGTQGC